MDPKPPTEELEIVVPDELEPEESPPPKPHLTGPTRQSATRTLRRLMRMSRPYAGVALLVVFCAIVFSLSRYTRAYLVQPLLDDVMVPIASTQTMGEGEAAPVPIEAQSPEREAAAALPDSVTVEQDRAQVSATIDAFIPRLWEIGLIGVATLIIAPLVIFGRGYFANWMVGRVRQDLDQTIARKFLTAPLSHHRNTTSGDMLSRALSDAQLCLMALAIVYVDVVTHVFMAIGGVATMFLLSWQLALIALMTVPPLFLLLTHFGRRIHRQTIRRQESQGELSQRLVAILSGIKVIKAFRGQEVEEAAFARETEKYFKRNMKVVFNRVMSKASTDLLNQMAGFVILAVAVWLAINGLWGVTLGTVGSFALILATTYKPVKSLVGAYAKVMEYVAGGERLFELIDAPNEPPDRAEAQPMEGLQHSIRFRNVGFAYTDEPVLRDIDLEVAPGEVIAVVGRTGSGKSTLMDLLLRFYDPDSGSIEIDGTDLRDLQRDSFLDNVAVVTQEPFLFDVSILENIRYGRPDATNDEVHAAAAAAMADEFIDQLPERYDTPVGEFGLRLSGGQRQRITIARAILANPAILVFDEATSALDAKTERAVQSAIEALRGQRTIFLVAHRLSTIRHADRIVVLDQGCVSEIGDHETLMSKPGIYRELVGIQEETAATG